MRRGVLLLGLCVFALGLPHARAGSDRAPEAGAAAASFQSFCARWMSKLVSRQEHNLAKAKSRRAGSGGVILEYTGYGSTPVRCEAHEASSGSGIPIGRIVYQELRMRKQGPDRRTAAKSAADVLDQIEVMEIFRFDGERWVY